MEGRADGLCIDTYKAKRSIEKTRQDKSGKGTVEKRDTPYYSRRREKNI